jgi:hypothetical protein
VGVIEALWGSQALAAAGEWRARRLKQRVAPAVHACEDCRGGGGVHADGRAGWRGCGGVRVRVRARLQLSVAAEGGEALDLGGHLEHGFGLHHLDVGDDQPRRRVDLLGAEPPPPTRAHAQTEAARGVRTACSWHEKRGGG